jgi:hypothetical protein
MKLTKGLLTLEQANAVCPEYVNFVTEYDNDGFENFEAVLKQFEHATVGAAAICAYRQPDGTLVFVEGKITKVDNNDWRAIDGPVVRFGNGELSWRVDGDKYAWLTGVAGLVACKAVVDEVMALEPA